MHQEEPPFRFPAIMVNTSMPAPADIYDASHGPLIHDSEHVVVGGRSVMVLTAGQGAA